MERSFGQANGGISGISPLIWGVGIVHSGTVYRAVFLDRHTGPEYDLTIGV